MRISVKKPKTNTKPVTVKLMVAVYNDLVALKSDRLETLSDVIDRLIKGKRERVK